MFSNKALKSLLIPLIIEQFLAISLGIADTMMVSTVGESAVSGVSLVDMLNVLIIDIFAGLASGGAVVASQFIGAKNRRGSERSSGQLILIAAISGIAVSAAVLLLRRPLLRLLFRSVEDEVMASALTYFTVTALSFPFISVYNVAAALFRSMGNSRISMISSLVINIINIIGNSIFIFGFGMGVAGAALSTLLSRFCAMAFLLVRLSVKDSELRLRLRNMIPDLSVIRKILYIGLPSCFENSLFQLGRILVVIIITGFGTAQIAANAIANNLDSFGCIPGKGLQLAVITVVGQCVGAQMKDETYFYARKLMKIAYALTAVANILVMATLPLTVPIYNVSDEAQHLAIILVLIHTAFAIILWPSAFVMPNVLRAGGDVKYTLAVSVFSMGMFRIVFSYIFALGFSLGAIGVWCAMVMDWVFRASMFVGRFRSGKWIGESLAK